jgi:tungstate transport system substrate-binding protein
VKKTLAILFVLLLAISVIGLIPACGDNSDNATTPAQTPTTISTPTATTVTTPIPTSTAVPAQKAKSRLRVATTTSLYDTGLWEYLQPMFEKQYNVHLDILSVGSGAALKYGQNGDVDVLTIHPKGEDVKFVADGYGVARVPFAYNHFLIVGPPNDPAGIKGLSPIDAFKKLAESGTAQFISRGDQSGTHMEEQAIWAAAGYKYADIEKSSSWYVEAGQGMGATLMMANEKQAYTLSDMGTFVSYKGKTNLVPIVDKGDILLNVYSVIVCTKTKSKDMAQNMVTFLTSTEIQQLIGNYGLQDYGIQLFTPCAGAEPTS